MRGAISTEQLAEPWGPWLPAFAGMTGNRVQME
jgi:hypothetical protein